MSDSDPPEKPAAPVAFLSYAWTDAPYRQRVRDLADRLISDGVEVVADFYDAPPGDDLDHYMERMVNDPRITKVVLLCNPDYQQKANEREGGVGTESQIVSGEVYRQGTDPERHRKFVAVLLDRNEDGSSTAPTYYGSRRFIDLSDPEAEEDEFRELLSFLFDRPARERPPLGSPPADVVNPSALTLGTSTRQRGALRALRDGHPGAVARLTDYLDTFAANLDRFRIGPEDHPESGSGAAWANVVVERARALKPYRDEAVEVFGAVAAFRPDEEAITAIRRFFGRVATLFEPVPRKMGSRGTRVFKAESDPFKLLWEELFLYCVGALLDRERYVAVGHLTRRTYTVSERGRRSQRSFGAIQKGVEVLKYHYRSAGSEPISPRGRWLVERLDGSRMDRNRLLEADALLHVNSLAQNHAQRSDGDPIWFWSLWETSTAPYLEGEYDPLPFFLRMADEPARTLPAFGVDDLAHVRAAFEDLSVSGHRMSSGRMSRYLAHATNAERLKDELATA